MSMTFLMKFFGGLRCQGPGEIIIKVKFQKSQAGKRCVGPTCRFAASPEVDPGATVDILQTGYPRI
jgi:hypothetical protein